MNNSLVKNLNSSIIDLNERQIFNKQLQETFNYPSNEKKRTSFHLLLEIFLKMKDTEVY